ncbi:formin-like protein 20 [Miscanthus floridulus]|uniref:formin-like protein 20 n=1 Tax=Miscanthus floridulus TaxID=154761 RepID=UPI00345AE0F5
MSRPPPPVSSPVSDAPRLQGPWPPPSTPRPPPSASSSWVRRRSLVGRCMPPRRRPQELPAPPLLAASTTQPPLVPSRPSPPSPFCSLYLPSGVASARLCVPPRWPSWPVASAPACAILCLYARSGDCSPRPRGQLPLSPHALLQPPAPKNRAPPPQPRASRASASPREPPHRPPRPHRLRALLRGPAASRLAPLCAGHLPDSHRRWRLPGVGRGGEEESARRIRGRASPSTTGAPSAAGAARPSPA